MPADRFGKRVHSNPNDSRRGGRYDSRHKRARAAAAARHHPTDPCCRCGHPLGPMNRNLHLDHTDDGTAYLGFSHGSPCPYCGRNCNLRAGAIKGNRRQAQVLGYTPRPAPRRATRTW